MTKEKRIKEAIKYMLESIIVNNRCSVSEYAHIFTDSGKASYACAACVLGSYVCRECIGNGFKRQQHAYETYCNLYPEDILEISLKKMSTE